MFRLRLTVALFVLALALVGGGRADAAEPEGGLVALIGGEVRIGDGQVLSGATVILRDGRVEAVGKDVAVPPGARRVDCAGKIITPGLIDADSALGMSPADLSAKVPGADARAADAFDPWDARLRTALRQGVTTLHLGANREHLIGGVAAVVSTGSPGSAAIDADGALVINVSTRRSAAGLGGAARVALVRSTFISVDYGQVQRERWRRDLAEYEVKRFGASPLMEEELLLPPELLARMRLWTPTARAAWRVAAFKSMGRAKKYTKPKKPATPPKAPREDPSTDVIASTLPAPEAVLSDDGPKTSPKPKGAKARKAKPAKTRSKAERRTFFRAELAADVDGALGAVRDFRLEGVIVGGQGLRDRVQALGKANVAVVVSYVGDTAWSHSSPAARREEGLGAALADAGLRPALGTGATGVARFLRLHAAREVGEGMDPQDALAAITLWAAEAAGVADETGSIAVGKRGDVVVWSGDPLDAATRAERVFVAGQEVDLERD